MIAPSSLLGRLLQALRLIRPLPAPIELAIADQLVLRALFHVRSLTFDDLSAAVESEGSVTRLEVLAALRKLELVGLLGRRRGREDEEYRATERARELAARIPVQPTVPMDVYL